MTESINNLVKEENENATKDNVLDQLIHKITSIKEGFAGDVLTINNIVIFIIIMVFYLIIMFFLKSGNIATSDSYESNLGKTIDFGVLVILGLAFHNLILYSRNKDIKTVSSEFVNYITDYVNEPLSILNSIFILVGFYVAVYLFKIPIAGPNKPTSVSIFESFIWGFLLIVVLLDVIKYFFDISLTEITDIIKVFVQEHLNDLFAEKNEKETKDAGASTNSEQNSQSQNEDASDVANTPENDSEKEVFNVSNNLYTYDDARNVCKSLNADIATYDQVEGAYRSGAEWCNYGWSEDQLALFPTQKESWNKLQKRDGKPAKDQCKQNNKAINNDCGRPGVNGGYISNPYVRFGVNCYGKKPEPSESDLQLMKSQKMLPTTENDKKLDEKVDKFKDQEDIYLPLNSHNYKKWSQKQVKSNEKPK